MPADILLAALLAATLLAVYQAARARVLAADHSWGLRSQGAWHWRIRSRGWLAWLRPVDLVHLDVDRLKQLNAALGEARVNDLLRSALRREDVYRVQHGDELAALTRPGDGLDLADRLRTRLRQAPLTSAELATLGGPITATVVVVRRVRRLRPALARAVALRERLKAAGLRDTVRAI